jgi:hypothetical protein
MLKISMTKLSNINSCIQACTIQKKAPDIVTAINFNFIAMQIYDSHDFQLVSASRANRIVKTSTIKSSF